MTKISLEELVAFLKEQGFVFQGSEIYGGLANAWDYGPLGSELKKNIKDAWWSKFVKNNKLNVGLDSAILMNKEVWVASGHLSNFADPLIDCKHCRSRYRADKLIDEATEGTVNADGFTDDQLMNYIKEHNITCPKCGSNDFTNIRRFNLMFKTFQGVVEDSLSEIYLRPETAQGIFINFKNVLRTSRKKLPFGIGQIGKSFRNEITPGNFIFRTREFEQMELEFFTKPGTEMEWFNYWRKYCMDFLVALGVEKNELRFRDHEKEELSFYSNATTDIEFNFPWGFGELWGIASRTDYDLKQHMNHSKVNLEYLDPETNEKYIPYVIEPSVGVERMMLAILFSAYTVEQLEKDSRVVLKLHPTLAPYKATILPLIKKNHAAKAKEIYEELATKFSVSYDEAGNIGKRYRRCDAIGTPLAITVDDNTINDNTVTIRDRDTMQQITLKVDELDSYILNKIKF